MRKNWSEMPPPLKWLTGLGLAVLIWPVVSAAYDVRAFGHLWTPRAWWSSGAGSVAAAGCALLAGSAALMLMRARHARTLYVLSWVALNASPLLTARLVHADPGTFSVGWLAQFVTITLGMIVYFAASNAVRTYFQPNG